MRAPANPRAPRAGLTLIEMLIVVILFGMVMGTMMTVIRRQQAFYRSASQMMEVRSQADQAFGILPRDLRAISSIGGDIFSMTDSSVTFRSQLGSTVVCAKTTNVLTVPPSSRLFKRHRLTTWRTTPVVGDEILVYDDGEEPSEVDDSWKTYSITAVAKGAVASANACPPSTGFVVAADTADSWRFTVSPNLSATIAQGAPVRFGRKVRYALYEAGNGEWYVGYEDSTGAGWSARGPVSGPHRPFSSTAGASGLNFAFIDDAGTELDPSVPTNAEFVARIDVTIRGMTKNDVVIPGKEQEPLVDSLYASVNLRNRQ
ncbi:MAG TPA: prepilin-type N-terminal cleavage/methylation domain-containing protein [Gemmatimonadaceae bacterium]